MSLYDDEFIDVCQGFLSRAENCPPDIARFIGRMVYDYGLGDVRKARGAWQLMTTPTEDEAHRVVQLMRKYSRNNHNHSKQQKTETKRLL